MYSDATQLNNFGTKKAWPVYLWLGNVPRKARLSRRDKGRAILVGYLPDVRRDCFANLHIRLLKFAIIQVPTRNGDNSSAIALHRVKVYHEAMRFIFESMQPAAKHGKLFDDGTNEGRDGVFVLSTASFDYEEAYVIVQLILNIFLIR